MEPGSQCRLVAGLGNPGREYENTRHNVGFMVADELVRRDGATFVRDGTWKAFVARVGKFALMKPLTFMNLSGESVGAFSRFHKLEPTDVLIVLDDVALPLGRLRLRRGGSPGGHNGLESVIAHLGTSDVPRLRVGIGAAGQSPLTDHVLGRFSKSEAEPLAEAITTAADAVEYLAEHGIERAMNRFNQPVKETN